jgi:predicted nucleic acid-binding protein
VQHQAARAWLDQQLNGSTRVGLPRVSLLAFLRLVTNPRVFDRPEPMIHAWHQVRAWIACETAWIPQPTERHADLLNELLASALALEHGLTLCSTDGDFARFPALRWINPLAL